MIKVNLVPIDELENQFWWVPEAAILLLIAGASFFGAQWYLGEIQKNIDIVSARAQSLEDNARQLEPELERFKDLTQKKDALNDKLDSLRKITVTKISKFQPVIVLEHFQNLKPEGLWFTKLKVGEPKGTFTIEGQSVDNLLLAEFITGIRSTEAQEKDDGDLRTHVYFSDLILKKSEANGDQMFADIPQDKPQFLITGKIRDKEESSGPAAFNGQAVSQKMTWPSNTVSKTKSFPRNHKRL